MTHRIIFLPVWVSVLEYIEEAKSKDPYAKVTQSSIFRKLHITYSYISKLITELEKKKLVRCRVKGRIKICNLTAKGKSTAMYLRWVRRDIR